MLQMQVKRYKAAGGLKALGDATPATGNLISNAIAEDYAEYLRRNYLSGQVLGVETGETRGSTKFFKEDSGRFGVRPGVGIRGRLNYLFKFERSNRPFMKPSFESYKRTGRHNEIMVRIINAMARKKL